jgi:hypothetical protein
LAHAGRDAGPWNPGKEINPSPTIISLMPSAGYCDPFLTGE